MELGDITTSPTPLRPRIACLLDPPSDSVVYHFSQNASTIAPAGYPVYVTDQPASAPADALALRLPAGGGQDHSPKNQQTALLLLLALLGYGAPTE